MNPLIIIPARLESSRLPNKMLLDETGRPLILHTIATAREAFDRIVVATDSAAIRAAVKDYVQVVMTGKCSSGTDRVRKAVADLKPEPNDIIVNWQGDEPELSPDFVWDLVGACQQNDVDVTTLAGPATAQEYQSTNVVKVVLDHDELAMYFSRCPIPYNQSESALKHIGIYAFTHESLLATGICDTTTYPGESLEQLAWLQAGFRIKTCVRPVLHAGIDTRAEYMEFVQRVAKDICPACGEAGTHGFDCPRDIPL